MPARGAMETVWRPCHRGSPTPGSRRRASPLDGAPSTGSAVGCSGAVSEDPSDPAGCALTALSQRSHRRAEPPRTRVNKMHVVCPALLRFRVRLDLTRTCRDGPDVTTDQKVGGSNPSERATSPQVRPGLVTHDEPSRSFDQPCPLKIRRGGGRPDGPGACGSLGQPRVISTHQGRPPAPVTSAPLAPIGQRVEWISVAKPWAGADEQHSSVRTREEFAYETRRSAPFRGARTCCKHRRRGPCRRPAAQLTN